MLPLPMEPLVVAAVVGVSQISTYGFTMNEQPTRLVEPVQTLPASSFQLGSTQLNSAQLKLNFNASHTTSKQHSGVIVIWNWNRH